MLPLEKGLLQEILRESRSGIEEKKAEMQENAVMLQHEIDRAAGYAAGKCKVSEGEYVTAGQSVVTITETRHFARNIIYRKNIADASAGQEAK